MKIEKYENLTSLAQTIIKDFVILNPIKNTIQDSYLSVSSVNVIKPNAELIKDVNIKIKEIDEIEVTKKDHNNTDIISEKENNLIIQKEPELIRDTIMNKDSNNNAMIPSFLKLKHKK